MAVLMMGDPAGQYGIGTIDQPPAIALGQMR
jgi:hypothetical protein